MKTIALEIKTLDNMIYREIIKHCKKTKTNMTSHIQFDIMGYMFNHTEVSQKALETKFDLRRSTLSGILDTMEKNDLIKRFPSTIDKRTKIVILTPKSQQLKIEMHKNVEEFQEMLIKDISLNDLGIFYKVMDQLKTNLKGDIDDKTIKRI